MERLVCIEFYGSVDPRVLLGAVDVPAENARSHAIRIGRYLCKIRARDAVNAVLLDARGETLGRMMVTK